MARLEDFALCAIDWEMTPEQAVTLYLEWGNNDWKAPFPPVRSRSDVSIYFVVDSWQDPPLIRLVRRNSEDAEDLFSIPMPEELRPGWRKASGGLRGVSAPTPEIRAWLRRRMGLADGE